jgi:hypothetical protein
MLSEENILYYIVFASMLREFIFYLNCMREGLQKVQSNNAFLRCFTVSVTGLVWRFVPVVVVVERGYATGAWYWKHLWTGTLAFERPKCAPGHKSSKECLTVMCCGNASGDHKLKLVVIGEAKNHDCSGALKQTAFSSKRECTDLCDDLVIVKLLSPNVTAVIQTMRPWIDATGLISELLLMKTTA